MSAKAFETPLAELHAGIDRLQARMDGLHEAALGEELTEIRRIVDRLESVFAHSLHRFTSSRGYAADGAVTAVSWLRWRCRLSPAAAVGRLSLAGTLGELPQTDDAPPAGRSATTTSP